MARQLRRATATAAPPAPPRRVLPRPTAIRPDFGQRGRGLTRFLGEVRSELRKVVWPTRREAAKLTALVVSISVAIGIILGLIDFAFAELFRAVLR